MSKEISIEAQILLTQHPKKACLGCGSLQDNEDGTAFGLLINLKMGLAGMQFFVCELCLKNFSAKIDDLKAQKEADQKKGK